MTKQTKEPTHRPLWSPYSLRPNSGPSNPGRTIARSSVDPSHIVNAIRQGGTNARENAPLAERLVALNRRNDGEQINRTLFVVSVIDEALRICKAEGSDNNSSQHRNLERGS